MAVGRIAPVEEREAGGLPAAGERRNGAPER